VTWFFVISSENSCVFSKWLRYFVFLKIDQERPHFDHISCDTIGGWSKYKRLLVPYICFLWQMNRSYILFIALFSPFLWYSLSLFIFLPLQKNERKIGMTFYRLEPFLIKQRSLPILFTMFSWIKYWLFHFVDFWSYWSTQLELHRYFLLYIKLWRLSW